jgi:hypothetical protein
VLRAFPARLLDSYPWLNDAFSVLSYLQELWHQYQSLVVLVGFYVVWRQLRQERIKLGERVDTLVQLVKAARDEAEAALAQPQSVTEPRGATPAQEDNLANWKAVQSIWRSARDRLELAIEGISRSNVRGKYGKLPRYTYRRVINALEADGVISPTVSNKLRTMDTRFNTLKFRPKSVTNADVVEFVELFELPNAKLPRLPEEPSAAESAAGEEELPAGARQAA